MFMLRFLDGRLANVGWLFWVFKGLEALFWIALVVLAVVLIVRAFRPRRGGPAGAPPPPPPPPSAAGALKILDERYARGEIDDEAYRRMKDQLRT